MSAGLALYVGRGLARQTVADKALQAQIHIVANEDGSLQVTLPKALKCAGCGRMALLFTSRHGSTLCSAECSPKAVRHG